MRLIDRVLFIFSRVSWLVLIVGLGGLFCISWMLMHYFEPVSPISQPATYWWYFLVTIATVGYGDLSPATLGGRIVGAGVIFFGIGLFAALLTKVAERLIEFSQRRRKGMVGLNVSGHIVLMGYRPGKTEEVVRELRADPKTCDRHIVLCSATAPENPFAVDHIDFVKGELTSNTVLENACVGRAVMVLIHGSDDHHTLATGIAVSSVAGETAHIVAYFRTRGNGELLTKVNRHVDVVRSLTVPMLVLSLQDPGSSTVFQRLASDLDADASQYRLNIPDGVGPVSFLDLFMAFKRRHNATVTALASDWSTHADLDINPRCDAKVRGGMSLFYIADHRLVDAEIDWEKLTVLVC